MGIQLSPGVNISEIDLTTIVPQVSTSIGGLVGHFPWGPADEIQLISDEVGYVATFGKPNTSNAEQFFTGSNFLQYGNNLKVVRVAKQTTISTTLGATGTGSTGLNLAAATGIAVGQFVYGASGIANGTKVTYYSGATAFAISSATTNAIANASAINFVTGAANSIYNSGTKTVIIKNKSDYESTGITAGAGPWMARYPGSIGDTLKIITVDQGSWAGSTGAICSTNTATIQSQFNSSPTTSSFASNKGITGAKDEVSILVVDEDGLFSGTPGSVLEIYQFLSKISDAKTDTGETNYYANVINNKSKYIRWNAAPSLADTTHTAWGTASTSLSAASVFNLCAASDAETTASLTGGSDDYTSSLTAANVGYNLFSTDNVDVNLLMAADAGATVVTSLVAIVEARRDCMLFFSPLKADVVNNAGNEVTALTTYIQTTVNPNSSFAFMDGNWKYQYDKYNDLTRWIPCNGDVAGLCARTDQTNDPWYSPAGYNRGIIKNVIKLAWNPTKSNRDNLYKVSVNPIISQPGTGTVLFGDKTTLAKSSAFDRINVRRLFIVLEKAIATASKYSLFEFNDSYTQAAFVGLVEPYLRDIKGRRGITDFRVVCDSTNNTAQVIDSNSFVGDIYLKPSRSINFIQLNFVAVKTGVEFKEIVGSF